MAHRLASSKRDTKNASAASCRHMMVLPWKCMSLLPTSWAISRTSHENGSFWIRSSVLFWYRWISWQGNCARLVLPGLLDLSCLQEFLLWGLASNGRAELPLGRLLSQSRWPSLCSHLGQLLGWWWRWWPTHYLQPTCLLNLHLSSPPSPVPPPSWVRSFWLGRGGALERGVTSQLSPSLHLPCQLPLPPHFFTPPPSLSGLPDKMGPLSPCMQHHSPLPLLSWSFLCSRHAIRKMKREGCSKRK